ncbi:MAG TPA: metallophosphoesterase, partial [Chitinophagaceae bacterium]|nr:metallophosphoesterase [Chitinophagaceae bacterium]
MKQFAGCIFLILFFNFKGIAQKGTPDSVQAKQVLPEKIITKASTPDSLQARIVLIGDAGEFTKDKQPVLLAVQQSVPLDAKTTIVFLGDNIYNTGLPDEYTPTYAMMKAILDSQIHIADNTKAKVYFMPGNHDWNNGSAGGLETIIRQQQYVDNTGRSNVKFYPEDGCPGPVEIPVSADVTLIIMDSQWWVHPFDKPGIESDCPFKTKEEVLTALDDMLSKNSKKLVVITFHHTLKSYGIHGGFFRLKQHVFPFTDVYPKLYIPLPVIGSVYPITRGIFGTSEDLSHPAYADMISKVQKVVKGHQNVILAAGHEHTLQLIKDSGYFYIVSGAASKATRINKNKKLLYGEQKNGFVTLDISKNKNVSVTFHTVDSGMVKKDFTSQLLNFSTIPTPENPNDTTRQTDISFGDSAVISASDNYKKATGFKNTVLGKNYREEWNTPVKLKVFNISKEKGGFKILSLGGAKQTKSLHLIDKRGKEWTLRSVDKDPEKAIPEALRGSLAQGIVQDMISASHPYGAMVVPGLAKAAGVVEPERELFYVPDDPALGIYRPMFAKTVCMLEERAPDNSAKIKSTAKIIDNLLKDHDNHVDQNAYLTARLLDDVIGDWDRHFDQ